MDSKILATVATPNKPVDALAAAASVPQPRSNTEIERTSGGSIPFMPSCGHATTDLRENCEACQRYFRQMETAVLGMAVAGTAQDWGVEDEATGTFLRMRPQGIRKARAKGVFNAAELAELDSEIPAPAAAQKNPAGAVAASAGVAQPRLAPARATPAGFALSPALGGSSSGFGARSTSDIARPSDLLIVEAT